MQRLFKLLYSIYRINLEDGVIEAISAVKSQLIHCHVVGVDFASISETDMDKLCDYFGIEF